MNFKNIKNLEDLKIEKSKFYSENGELKILQRKIREIKDIEEKKHLGLKIKKLKEEAEEYFSSIQKNIEEKIIQNKIENEWIDVSSPCKKEGGYHPLTLISNRFKQWFVQNGYFQSFGSEIESDEYNFERLNIPKEHPARDMHDTLYINDSFLLRTHNTGFTARELEKNTNKSFSHYTIGKVYRNDEDDQTHSHQFTQIDLVSVGYYSFSNLIWTLKNLISYVLEEEIEIRMRPSFFPFTEPSVEVDIFYKNKWIEVLGAGMLNNIVLEKAGYTNDMNSFAAGIGIERMAMIKYGINDIREFYTNDLRFLDQFKGGK